MSAPDLRASMPVRVVDNLDAFEEHGQPGDVLPTTASGGCGVEGYLMRCPGCGQESSLPLGSSPGARWTVTAGDPQTGAGLTLSPSVWHRVPSCGWHGWVRDGRWVPC